jgi:hypothetical protein
MDFDPFLKAVLPRRWCDTDTAAYGRDVCLILTDVSELNFRIDFFSYQLIHSYFTTCRLPLCLQTTFWWLFKNDLTIFYFNSRNSETGVQQRIQSHNKTVFQNTCLLHKAIYCNHYAIATVLNSSEYFQGLFLHNIKVATIVALKVKHRFEMHENRVRPNGCDTARGCTEPSTAVRT